MNTDMLKSALLLALFTLLGASTLLWVHANTSERIAENERQLLLTRLGEILPADAYDNDLVTDTQTVTAPDRLGSSEPLTVYRARRDGKPVAAILTSVAPDGYNGDIRLLVGVDINGKLTGVRAIRHHETPGLGDNIETGRSDWIRGFKGKSLRRPEAGQWAVKKDGGEFDSFTGATITPRAVVKAVHNTLLYYRDNRQQLFAPVANNGNQS